MAVGVLCGGLVEIGETEKQGWSTERPKEKTLPPISFLIGAHGNKEICTADYRR